MGKKREYRWLSRKSYRSFIRALNALERKGWSICSRSKTKLVALLKRTIITKGRKPKKRAA